MTDDQMLSPAKAQLDSYLKEHGMRRTPERYAILEKVFSTDAHFYVDALHEALTLEGRHFSLSTVYATIQLFLEAGLGRSTNGFCRVSPKAITIWCALRVAV